MKDSEELIRALTPEEQEKRGWKVFVNGEEVPDAASVEIRNEKMGASSCYGMRVEGYDGIVWREPGGGGSVILPYTLWGGELYIGVVSQNRSLQKSKALAV